MIPTGPRPGEGGSWRGAKRTADSAHFPGLDDQLLGGVTDQVLAVPGPARCQTDTGCRDGDSRVRGCPLSLYFPGQMDADLRVYISPLVE